MYSMQTNILACYANRQFGIQSKSTSRISKNTMLIQCHQVEPDAPDMIGIS